MLLAAAGPITPALAQSLACDDGIKTAFHPDPDTTVVAVRLVKKGEELSAADVPKPPIKAAAELCLVKLLVGPGVTAENDAAARSFSQGIGIEVWLPARRTGEHPQLWRRWMGRRRPSLSRPDRRQGAGDRQPIWLCQGPLTPGNVVPGRLTFCPRQGQRRAFRDFRCARWWSRPSRPGRWSACITARHRNTAITTAIPRAAGRHEARSGLSNSTTAMIAAPASIRFGTAAYPRSSKTDLGYRREQDRGRGFAAKVDAANEARWRPAQARMAPNNPFQCDYDPPRCRALCTGVPVPYRQQPMPRPA